MNLQLGGTLYTKGAFSLLHLNGYDGNATQESGYRTWMRPGLLMTNNGDLMYVGPQANTAAQTDLTIAFGDNYTESDNLRFAFTAQAGAGASNVQLLQGEGPNGREILRMIPNGNVGIGPAFDNVNAPQCDLHINVEDDPVDAPTAASAKMQYTINTLTGRTASDGFQISVEEFADVNETGTALFKQFENKSIRFLSSSLNNGTTLSERMRITTVSDLVTENPGLLAAGTTRVAISSDPALPLNKPRSLLHLGTNLNVDNDGWRKWMNVGTLAGQGGFHYYAGIRPAAWVLRNYLKK